MPTGLRRGPGRPHDKMSPALPPMHSIVAATDLSAPARHAAERAGQLAAASGASLTLVHALGAGALDKLRRWLEGDVETALRDSAERALRTLAGTLAAAHAGLRIDTRLASGRVVDEIAAEVARAQAGLVVCGTRGAGFLRRQLLGSTAERIARQSALPVLMARTAVRGPYRRLIVAVDFSRFSPASLAQALRVAPAADIVLLHAVTVPMESQLRVAGVADSALARYREAVRADARTKLQALADGAGLDPARVQLLAADGADAWMQIAEAEQALDADLVVVGRQGSDAVEALLLGSTTRMVIGECGADVLIATAEGDA